MRGALGELRSIPVTILLVAIATTAQLAPELATRLTIDLRDTTSLATYRLVGCHLIHWSAEHFFWDIGMFVLLAGFCERWWPRACYLTLAVSAIAIPLAVAIGHPEITSYRGLSGLDTGLFALLATRLLIGSLAARDRVGGFLFAGMLAALAAKVAMEFQTGDLWFVTPADFTPLPLAHLIGGLIGVAAGVMGRGLVGEAGVSAERLAAHRCSGPRSTAGQPLAAPVQDALPLPSETFCEVFFRKG